MLHHATPWIDRYLRVWGNVYLLLVLLLTLASMYTLCGEYLAWAMARYVGSDAIY
jgi:hypothetical protein